LNEWNLPGGSEYFVAPTGSRKSFFNRDFPASRVWMKSVVELYAARWWLQR
jgi:hypothetical protein